MKSFVIGIAGKRNSGKDTVASMINYIFAAGVTNASYAEWMTKKSSYDYTNADRIVHFADKLKDVLSIIYNIPRKYFDDRQYKDEIYYCITTNKFILDVDDYDVSQAIIIDDEYLNNHTIKDALDTNKNKFIFIKLRNLMQYFGTTICRTYLDNNIWIKSTMSKIEHIAIGRKLCIVPDVRFENEAKAITNMSSFLYGGLIAIKRDNCSQDRHISENASFKCDYYIDNNGSKLSLFYKTLEICQKINSQRL